MSYYYNYIKGLCPECDDWVITQICGELDRRDKEVEELTKEIGDLEKQLESKCLKVLTLPQPYRSLEP